MTLRVLLVDDNATRATAVAETLRANGCDVVAILPAPTDLVAEVRKADAEVIVCDIDAPSRDAIDCMRALNRDEPRPVVMFVDHSDPEHINDAVGAGVAAYVIEGLAPNRVRAVIDVAVARFRAHQALKAELHNAKMALSERKLVERAKGILMQTRKMSEDDAYKTMRRLAMDQGKRLSDVAGSVIALADVLRESAAP
jgi:response regulator NasT